MGCVAQPTFLTISLFAMLAVPFTNQKLPDISAYILSL